MNMQLQLLLIWVLNGLALLAVANYVPGIHVDGFGAALIAGWSTP
jgi:putative membrane protein